MDGYLGDEKRERGESEVPLHEFMKAVYELGRKKYDLSEKKVDELVEEAARLNGILNGAEERDREFKDIKRKAEYAKKRTAALARKL